VQCSLKNINVLLHLKKLIEKNTVNKLHYRAASAMWLNATTIINIGTVPAEESSLNTVTVK